MKQKAAATFEDRREITWSLMKIKSDCVGVTSARVLDKCRHVKGPSRLFVELPKSFCNVGVKSVILHRRLLDEQKKYGVSNVDLVVVVLEGLPTIDGRVPERDQLVSYPEKTISYEDSLRGRDIIGRSSLDFVTGRCLMKHIPSINQQETKGMPYFTFLTKNMSEKGDDGTLMFAVDPEVDGNERK